MRFSSDPNLTSERGFSLISALISAAIIGILVVMLATLNDNMAKAMLRSNMQRAADNLQRQITGVLSEKAFCAHAIRNDAAGTSRVTWKPPFDPKPFPFILLDTRTGTPTVLASKLNAINPLTGKPYNQVIDGLFIKEITLQTRDINNDGSPDPAVVNEWSEPPVGTPLKRLAAVPAEIRITYRGAEDAGGNPIPGTQWVGGAFKSRAIPVVLVMDRDADYVIERCEDSVAASKDSTCTGPDAKAQALSDMGASACLPATCPQTMPVRTELVVLAGYDSGIAKCACYAVCDYTSWTWQPGGLQSPVGLSDCTEPTGAPCMVQGQYCKLGSIGTGGKVHTRKCG